MKLRRLAAAVAALILGAVSAVPAALPAQGQPPQDAFIAELAEIRRLPADQLDHAGALALADNHCLRASQGWDATHPTDALIREAAITHICPEEAR